MITKLQLLNLPPESQFEKPAAQQAFYLETCQRKLILGFDLDAWCSLTAHLPGEKVQGPNAYLFLLETICGLKSKLLAEQEIISQFKEAYRQYLQSPTYNYQLGQIIEKMFKDAKEIRTNYLKAIGQHSYAGITRKLIKQHNTDGKVLIIGAGKLACNLIKNLKKYYCIYLTARDEKKARQLCQQEQVNFIQWKDHSRYLEFNNIINTIGANETLFQHHFFLKWHDKHRIFVDLGVNSSINTSFDKDHGIIRLADIWQQIETLDQNKLACITKARQAIHHKAQMRQLYFTNKYKPLVCHETSML